MLFQLLIYFLTSWQILYFPSKQYNYRALILGRLLIFLICTLVLKPFFSQSRSLHSHVHVHVHVIVLVFNIPAQTLRKPYFMHACMTRNQ